MINRQKVKNPRCTSCGSYDTWLDFRSAQNLWRVPLATVTGMTFFPLVRMNFACSKCKHRFVGPLNAFTRDPHPARPRKRRRDG
jgi:hypothetical protein